MARGPARLQDDNEHRVRARGKPSASNTPQIVQVDAPRGRIDCRPQISGGEISIMPKSYTAPIIARRLKFYRRLPTDGALFRSGRQVFANRNLQWVANTGAVRAIFAKAKATEAFAAITAVLMSAQKRACCENGAMYGETSTILIIHGRVGSRKPCPGPKT